MQQPPTYHQPPTPTFTQYNQPPHQPRRYNVFILLMVTLIVGMVTIAVGLYGWFGVLNASCTVGVTGYAANVEFTGLGASGACSHMIQSEPTYFYQYQGEPTGTEMCVGDYHMQGSFPVHYVVRDTGLFDLVGTALCKGLSSGAIGSQQ